MHPFLAVHDAGGPRRRRSPVPPDQVATGVARVGLPPARSVALVAAGGALGALARVAQTAAFPSPPAALPWATLAENVVGAFLLGWLLTLVTERLVMNNWARPLLGTGLLGAYTTFATVGLELLELATAGRAGLAAVYLALTWVGGLAAGGAGIAAGRLLPRRGR